VTAAGGTDIPVAVDHADDAQVRSLFARITEDHGHLDLLVNNVSALPPDAASPPPFWIKRLEAADQITVGLRSAYAATYAVGPTS